MKKILVTLLKIGISLGIIAWLARAAYRDEAFADLAAQYRDPGFQWGLLAAAAGCCATAVLITLVRWYCLVRALGMQLTLREALRIGFLGYLFNLAPMGIVGGDLLKAVLLARQQPTRRAQAFATVAVDRVIGLYMLFVVASAAILGTGFWQHELAEVRYISRAALLATAAGSAGLLALLIPGITRGRITRAFAALPYVGPPLEHLIDALRMYRSRPGVLLGAAAVSIAVHSLFTTGIYLITRGIYLHAENVGNVSFSAEFIVVPLSESVGVIPLMMGPMEVVLDFLYASVFGLDKRQGFVIALGYRLITLLIALVGVVYYWSARRELSEVMHEAKQAEAPPTQLRAASR